MTDSPKPATSLASIIESVRESEAAAPDRPALRVSILRNYTVEQMLPLFKFHCLQQGLTPVISVGEYDNIAQEILDPSSHVYARTPDIVVLSVLLEHLDPLCAVPGWDPGKASSSVMSMLAELVARTRATILVNTFIEPSYAEDGLGAARDAHHRAAKIRALNETLRGFSREHPSRVYIVDWERILRILGEDRAIDRRFYYMYRAPFRKDFADAYGAEIAKVGRLLKGKTRKCLVLDCDNTLWGGVIGEDGVDGIALDANEYPGRCFFDFQRSIMALIEQGVVVALCSKNNEDDVFEVLDKHPHCLLKRSHLAAWRINWNNKADNVLELARELNLGVDSFVFVDDNSVECQLIKEAIPDVVVLQVPPKVYELPRLLFRDGWFDSLSISAEDRQRTAMYVADHQRRELQNRFSSIDEYLQSLELVADVHPATENELPRVAQLLGKTNQFNLTTRRHSEAQVRELAAGADSAVYVIHAKDKFSELGLVGVLIARRNGSQGTIDSLLMSCRALGRKFEEVFVDRCLEDLEARWGITQWDAEYIPTKKNKQVGDFWSRMGFGEIGEQQGHVSYRAAARARFKPSIAFISVSR